MWEFVYKHLLVQVNFAVTDSVVQNVEVCGYRLLGAYTYIEGTVVPIISAF